MAAPTIKKFTVDEKLTAEDLNTVFQALGNKFGNLAGDDFFYPLIMGGDLNLTGHRLLRVKELFGILNMEEYGADADGFNEAISGAVGSLVLIPRSFQVDLTRGVKITDNKSRIYIVGCGFSSVLKMADGSDDTAISIDGCKKFRICNLYINGNRANTSGGNGISINNCQDFEISNVWIGNDSTTGSRGNGIEIYDSDHFSIKRCWIRNPYDGGILVGKSETFNISQNLIDMTGSPASEAGKNAIVLQDTCRGAAITSNSLRQIGENGIVVHNSHEIKIAYNSIASYGNAQLILWYDGIAIGGQTEANNCTGISVIGNTITNGETGISVGSYVNGCNVIGNYVRGLTNPLWYGGRDTSQVNFRGNLCMDNLSNNGRITFAAAATIASVNIGKAGLPIQAIHATWDVFPSYRVSNCVLGARYSGMTVYFYSSSAVPDGLGLGGYNPETAWYTIEV